jgi:cell division protein ZapA (FtsZ GTPase activity inhibitor)
MADHAVELNVAGQKCRVVSSAGEEELETLARMVEEKLARIVPPGRPITTQAVILAAVALANDVRTERQRADAIAAKAKASLEAMLGRVESALGECEAPSSGHPSSLRVPAKKSRHDPSKRSDGE